MLMIQGEMETSLTLGDKERFSQEGKQLCRSTFERQDCRDGEKDEEG